jgi:hypothetical protein
MVFVSENEKTGTFSLSWMSTAIYVCVRMKKQELSHFHGCQQQFMYVSWFLSVRMEKQYFSHFAVSH